MLERERADPLRIRVIDDNLSDVDLIRRLLESVGKNAYEIDATGVAKALAVSQAPDAILFGPQLLDWAALQLIATLRNRWVDTAIVVLPGHADEAASLESIRHGAQDVVMKTELQGTALSRRLRFAIARKGEERLLRLGKAKADETTLGRQRFLANVSHELRTPLGAIMGFAEIIRDRHLGPDVASVYCERADDIHQSAGYLLRLINDLLDLTRVDAGQLKLEDGDVDMRHLIGATCALLQRKAMVKGVRLRTGPLDNLPRLCGDRDRLQQIIVNLVSNAVKFTPAGGNVTVEGRILADGRFAVAVRDTGIGISRDRLPAIWRPFGQIANEFQNSRDGTGLGLPLSDQLARLHGGSIDVESVPGQGSVFTLFLPETRILPRADVEQWRPAAS